MHPDLPSFGTGNKDFCSVNHVAILMATYQGAEYLAEQLDSIEKQTFKNWTLWVSDDNSSDKTRDILRFYQEKWGENRLKWLDGPCKGFALNFMSLICNSDINANYYALADQDDIWLEEKLSRAVNRLASTDTKEKPLLYCARTLLVDNRCSRKQISSGLHRPPGFSNAIVQNIASGNTMMFNYEARELMLKLGANVDIPLHDWWLYIVISGCGGGIYFDDHPEILYRQHDNNAIGMRYGIATFPGRIRRLFCGKHALQIERNIKALTGMKELLSSKNRKIFEEFSESRDRRGIRRLKYIFKSGVYRQTFAGNMVMIIGAIINKA